MSRIGLLLLAFGALPVQAAAPLPASYAESMWLTAEPGKPVQQLELPAAVYAGVVSSALADVQVFDAAGAAVPQVFCEPPRHTADFLGRFELPVYPVRLAQAASGSSAELRTDAGRIAITLPQTGREAVAVSAYELDLSAIEAEATRLQLGWHSPSGLSEVHLQVEQSDTAGRWQMVVPDAVLKRLTAAGQTLETADIALPRGRYQRLRLTPRDAAGTVIERAELFTQTLETRPESLRRFTAVQTGTPPDTALPAGTVAQGYRAEPLAPLSQARLLLTEPNSRKAVQLQSRPGSDVPWQTHWSGEAFYLLVQQVERRNADIALPSVRHREWRVLVEGGSTQAPPILEFGYSPELLRFVAQGQGPYRLAYGSAAASALPAVATTCEGLLQPLLAAATTSEREQLIGSAEAGPVQVLAGPAARQPLPPAEPPLWRRGLLWGVLLLAVGLLLWMARGLLADLKTPKP